MSFRRNPPEGELPEANQLYNDPEINKADLISPDHEVLHEVPSQPISSDSERHTPLYRRRGFKNAVALGMSAIALGTALFLGGCGKPKTPPETAAQTTQEQQVEQVVEQPSQETQQPNPEDIIVMRDPGEVSPRIVRELRDSLDGLAYVDSQGWIHPNEVDGTYGHYEYDFSDPNQTILAVVEAINTEDADLIEYLKNPFFRFTELYGCLVYPADIRFDKIYGIDSETQNDASFLSYVMSMIKGEANNSLREEDKTRIVRILDKYRIIKGILRNMEINKYKVVGITRAGYIEYAEELVERIINDYENAQSIIGTDIFPPIDEVRIFRLEIDGHLPDGDYMELVLFKINGEYKIGLFHFLEASVLEHYTFNYNVDQAMP